MCITNLQFSLCHILWKELISKENVIYLTQNVYK